MQISFNDNLLNENLGLSRCAGGDYRGQEANERKEIWREEGRSGWWVEAINLNLCNLSATGDRISKLSTNVIKSLLNVLLDGGMWCRPFPYLSFPFDHPTHPKCVQTHSHFFAFRKYFSSAICSILFPPKYKTQTKQDSPMTEREGGRERDCGASS